MKFRKTTIFSFTVFLFVIAFLPLTDAAENDTLRLLETRKIWDQGPTNAFTDLVHFKDRFFCVFREAEAHVSPDGTIRVISSTDGKEWKSEALLELNGYDLRDPKIVVHPDGTRLMIYGGAAVREGNQTATKHRSFMYSSQNGRDWSPIEWIAEEGQWLWRVTWFGDITYGVAYDASFESRKANRYGTALLQSSDGSEFVEIVSDLFHEHSPNEATLRFSDNGECYCLLRRDGREDNSALLGTSKPPYKKWSWKNLGRYFGGPNFIQIPSGAWIASGRFKTKDGSKTVVCRLDVEKGEFIHLITLPSGGDTSYPGMILHGGKLWISYYSSHEGKTCIYLAIFDY